MGAGAAGLLLLLQLDVPDELAVADHLAVDVQLVAEG